MLRPDEIAFAVDLQQRAHRLLQWMKEQLDDHDFAVVTPHDGLDDATAALQWVQANWRRLPANCVPRHSAFAPFANLLASFLVTSFTITDEPKPRVAERWACRCALCSRLVPGSHLQPRKVLPEDKRRARALKFDHVGSLAVERGKDLGDAAIDALLDGDELGRTIAMATWAEHLLRRSRGDNEGPAVFALWREFAWKREGSPDPRFELDARALFEAELALALRIDPSLRRVLRIHQTLAAPAGLTTSVLVPLDPAAARQVEDVGLRTGDPVELRRPDGTIRNERVDGLWFGGGQLHLAFGSGLGPDDLPPGTELWLPVP